MNLVWFLIKNIHKLTPIGVVCRLIIKHLTITIGTVLIIGWSKINNERNSHKTNIRVR